MRFKQEAHGPQRSPEKISWKSINIIYMIIIMLIKRKKLIFYFMRIEWVFIWTNLNSLHPRMHCSRFGWNWSTSWEEDFLKFRQSSFEQIWVPSTKGCIVPSLVEIDPVVLAKKIKMWKVYANDDNDDDDDDGQRTNFDQKKLTWAFG